MRLLLDECVPRTLIAHLGGLDVAHVRDLGWKSLDNGDLLRAMRDTGYSILVTVDLSLRFQQPLGEYGVSVVILVAVGNTVQHLVPLVPELMRAVNFVQPGQCIRLGG